ncbi:hypothetical protein BKA80DRAFT_252685 [Phyllosticta citrichinensis]
MAQRFLADLALVIINARHATLSATLPNNRVWEQRRRKMAPGDTPVGNRGAHTITGAADVGTSVSRAWVAASFVVVVDHGVGFLVRIDYAFNINQKSTPLPSQKSYTTAGGWEGEGGVCNKQS